MEERPKRQSTRTIAHISKLFIPSSARDAAEKSKPVQIQGGWPAINAVIDDLTYGNMRLGKLELVARNTPSTKGTALENYKAESYQTVQHSCAILATGLKVSTAATKLIF